MKPELSVIIVNHNAKDFLCETLKSLVSQKGITLQIILVDNHSTDNSREAIIKLYPQVTWISRDTNTGFSAANNLGLKYATSETILFLNPDVTFTSQGDLRQCLDRLAQDSRLGALTPRVDLVLGGVDKTCHRGFPTPWASFTHFSGLSKLFPNVPLFNQYTRSYLGYTNEHEIDAVGGMFILMRRNVGAQVQWWDEDYSFYGEDLDLCYRLNQAGYANLYYPSVTVLHHKGATTGMTTKKQVDSSTTRQVKIWSIQAMEIFYRKHYMQKYPFFINWLVFLGIKLLKFRRIGL